MNESERPSPAYSNYVLAVLFVVYVFNFVDRQLLSILVKPIREELGVSDTVMGILLGPAFAFFYTLAGIPIARFADRASRRTVIAIGLTLWSAMTAASGLARSALQLALARMFVGVGEAAGSPPSHALISDYFPPERRATALSIYATGIYLGAMGAYLGGAYIVTHFDWRTAFIAVGLAGLPLALLVRFTVRELPRGYSENAVAEDVIPLREALRYLVSLRSFLWLVVAASCQSLQGYAFLAWGPAFLGRVHGMASMEIGSQLGVIIGVFGSVGALSGGWLGDRLGVRDARWYVWLSALVSLVGLPFAVGFLLLPNPGTALASFAIYYVLGAMYVGPLWSMTQGLVKLRMRATASAILLFILNIVGLGLGPFVVGVLNDRLATSYGDEAIRYSLLCVTLIGGLSAIFFYLSGQTLRQDLKRTGES